VDNFVSVRIPIETYRDYFAAAERRAQSPKQLISAVLVMIAQDNLFNAVLDEPGFTIREEGHRVGGERSRRGA